MFLSSGMQSEKSYEGACVVCTHKWTGGLTGSQCCFGGYRTFLPAGSRGRQARVRQNGLEYEYAGVETRRPARFRDTRSARRCLAVVEALDMPCGGHKSPPLIARWPGFDWYRMSPPELMHDSKIFVEMLLKVLVGKVSGTGFYGGWSYDNKHRREAEIMGIFESIWPCNMGPLPWRLTTAQRKMLNTRMGKLVWPQHIEKLYYNGDSFWAKPDRIWKARRKIRLLYFILSTQLRDQVGVSEIYLASIAVISTTLHKNHPFVRYPPCVLRLTRLCGGCEDFLDKSIVLMKLLVCAFCRDRVRLTTQFFYE